MKVRLNPAALTFADMEDFEERTGSSLLDVFDGVEKPEDIRSLRMRDLVALLWICVRAEQPEFTYDDARKLRITELEVEIAADPTAGGE